MKWLKHVSEPEIVVGNPGDIIPCDNPQTAIVVPPPDPLPDLSTKPDGIVGYCFGYACPKKHTFGYFDSITLDGYKIRKPCPKCGEVSKPAVIKRTAEARWGDKANPSVFDLHPEPNWGWYNSYLPSFGKSIGLGDILWTSHEFVHYLDQKPRPRRRKK